MIKKNDQVNNSMETHNNALGEACSKDGITSFQLTENIFPQLIKKKFYY